MTDLPESALPHLGPDVYRAEKIVKRRKKRNDYQYFVKWHGYDSDQNTWEPPENIIDKNLLSDFINKASSKRVDFDENDAQDGDEPEESNAKPKNADNSIQQQSSSQKKKKKKDKRERHHEGHYHHAKSKIIAIPIKPTATITSDETSDEMKQASPSPSFIVNEPSANNPTLETQDKNRKAMSKPKSETIATPVKPTATITSVETGQLEQASSSPMLLMEEQTINSSTLDETPAENHHQQMTKAEWNELVKGKTLREVEVVADNEILIIKEYI